MTNDEIKKILGNPLNDIMRGITQPVIPKMPEIHIPTNPNLASEFHKRLVTWINAFDKGLDNAHEVGVRLVSFGQSFTFHLEDIGYWNPSLISFKGHSDNGEPVELIQHVSQISILLLTMKRPDPTKPKRPIGFVQPEEEKEE
jgi:hypothetical protein